MLSVKVITTVPASFDILAPVIRTNPSFKEVVKSPINLVNGALGSTVNAVSNPSKYPVFAAASIAVLPKESKFTLCTYVSTV